MIEPGSKINVAMVGYFNTIPFLHGFEKNLDLFSLKLDYPARCIEYYDRGEVDIALVPLATLIGREDYKIISNYCIGCNGEVRTVCLFSNDPIQNIKKVFLDNHSRTSQLLTKILVDEFWNINVEYEEVDIHASEHKRLDQFEAVLKIGDKVFDVEHNYKYKYDLGEIWKKWQGLPFAFAVWIGRKDIDESVIQKLNESLLQGVEHMEEAIQAKKGEMSHIDINEYFSKNIDYILDDGKRKAIDIFMKKSSQLLEVDISVGA